MGKRINKLWIPIKMDSVDAQTLSSLERLRLDPGFQFICNSFKAQLEQLIFMNNQPIDIANIDSNKALSILAAIETNKGRIEQLRGFINIIDITVAEIRKKYENAGEQVFEGHSDVYN